MSSWKRTAVRNIPQYQRDEELENLLVFGYECKLFRDDAKAKYLDQGRHLIPWMGDPSLMIDRYDGRGHLHDLWPYDADNVVNNADDLSAEEKKLEELCDEERYLELNTDVVEKAIYEEEELKRLNEAISDGYSAVAFNYDQNQAQNEEREQKPVKVDEDEAEPFYAPPELQMPPDVIPPETMKQNAIIEKTALFISKHSAQMEIVIKTKQKNNPQFAFLEYNNELNPYYKHVVKMIKSAKYQPYSQRERQNSDSESTGYLHPSLSRSVELPPVKEQTREEFMLSVSSKVPSGQIANTPYAKLLSNLTKHTEIGSPRTSFATDHTVGDVLKLKSAGSVSHHLSHSVYSHHAGYNHCDISDMSSGVHLHSDMLCTNGQPPPPGTVPPGPLPILDANPSSSDYQQSAQSAFGHVLPPPPDLQPVIDKMAVYVAKNGPEFELIVRRKNDTRFEFLNAGHVHNPYYEHKKKLYLEEIAASKCEKVNGRKPARDNRNTQQNKSISFSLRTKENVEGLSSGLRSTALLYESSDEEDDDSEKATSDGKTDSVTVSTDVTMSAEISEVGQTADNTDKKFDEARLKDKLALAAREKLAQASKENQIKAERKRKAAMFINMLKSSQTKPVLTQETTANASQPMATVSSTTGSPQVSRSQSPLSTAKSQTTDSHCSASQTPLHQSHSPSIPSVSRLSKSPTPRRRSPSPRRRSPSPRRWSPRRRSRSPLGRRKRSRTPPSAYTRLSPVSKHCSHSHVASLRYKHRRSRSRTKDRGYGSKLGAPRSRSRSRSKAKARSPSRKSHKSSRSHGKSSRKRSRSRTRRHSRSRRRSRSRSRSGKSKSKKKKHSSSRSPKKRRSDEKRSHRKKKMSSRDENRSSAKDVVMCSSDSEAVIIADDKSEQSELPTGSPEALLIESDAHSSPSSSPQSESFKKCFNEDEKPAALFPPLMNKVQEAQVVAEDNGTSSIHVAQSDSREMSPQANDKPRSPKSSHRQLNDLQPEVDMFAE